MLAWAVAAAALLWLVVLAGTASGVLDAAAAVIFRFSSFICHQQPDRSFHWQEQWPVCARCLGLYALAPAGAVAGAVVTRAGEARIGNFLLLCIAAIPTAGTWLAEHAAGWSITNGMRFVAALPLGAVVAWVIARTLRTTGNIQPG